MRNGKDRPRCVYCGRPISRKGQHYFAKESDEIGFFTIEHVVPRSLGGRDLQENVVGACRTCNGRRGNLGFTEFIRSLGEASATSIADAIEIERRALDACINKGRR